MKHSIWIVLCSAALCILCLTGCMSQKTPDTNSTLTSQPTMSRVESTIGEETSRVISNAESALESMVPNDKTLNNRNSATESAASSQEEAALPAAAALFDGLSSLDTTVQGWGPGTDTDEQNIPTSCIDFQERYAAFDARFYQPSEEKTIVLTFDEGYENGNTAKILQTLREKQCPAAFFITGDYLKSSPELVEQMLADGHQIGNHTMSHPSLPTISPEAAAEDITALSDAMREQFHYTMRYLRPPKGEFSEQSLALTKRLGFTSVLWSFAYRDWLTDDQPDREEALTRLTHAAHPGAIYLLHAVSSTNAAILSDFIDNMRTAGYQFVPLAE